MSARHNTAVCCRNMRVRSSTALAPCSLSLSSQLKRSCLIIYVCLHVLVRTGSRRGGHVRAGRFSFQFWSPGPSHSEFGIAEPMRMPPMSNVSNIFVQSSHLYRLINLVANEPCSSTSFTNWGPGGESRYPLTSTHLIVLPNFRLINLVVKFSHVIMPRPQVS